MNRLRLEQLTGLRFLAAVVVFLGHCSWENSNATMQTIFSNGYVGVSFFFVLSGFVLSFSYKEKMNAGLITFKQYFLLRAARLTPMHFATGIPILAYTVFNGSFSPAASALNL